MYYCWYVCDCTNVVYMFCVYCIYYYVNKFEARSLFSTSHLEAATEIPQMNGIIILYWLSVLGYEPADLTVHPPPQNCRGWVHCFRIGV